LTQREETANGFYNIWRSPAILGTRGAVVNEMSPTDYFSRLDSLGYQVVPIIPPDATPRSTSSLKTIGKAPGRKAADGLWDGIHDWVNYRHTQADLLTWRASGAGVGIKGGEHPGGFILGFDADTLNPEWADIIAKAVHERLGKLPKRIGNAPKALWMCRLTEPWKCQPLLFGPSAPRANGKGSVRPNKIELLTTGRQFVAHGIHPSTRRAYRWEVPYPELSELPMFEPREIVALLEHLRSVLPDCGKIIAGDASTSPPPPQESLRGDVDLVRKALAAAPNVSPHFDSRSEYFNMAVALKASLPDNPDEAWKLFSDWSAGWEENTPEGDRILWDSIHAPYTFGVDWLCHKAEKVSGGAFTAAQRWFEEPAAEEQPLFPFADGEGTASASRAPVISATPYDYPEPSAIPPRESLYAGHYVRQFVSNTLAPSKVGKTFHAIMEALILASGKPLLGVAPSGPCRVWFWNGEDPIEELQRRVAAAMQFHGLTREDMGGRLFLDSGRQMPIVVARQLRTGVEIMEPVKRAFMETCRANALDVAILDPFIRTHQVNENDNIAIEEACRVWAHVADAQRMAIELIHHVRKLNGGVVTIEDTRGASAMTGVVRSSRALANMTKDEAETLGLEHLSRRLFRIADSSSNLFLPAEGEAERWLERHAVNLGNGRGDGVLDAMMNGDSIAVVRVFDMAGEAAKRLAEIETPETGETVSREQKALELLASGEWKADSRSGEAWAGRAVIRALGHQPGDKNATARAKTILKAWLRSGKIREFDKFDKNNNMRTFIEVA